MPELCAVLLTGFAAAPYICTNHRRWGARMGLWSWVQLIAAALSACALAISVTAERTAAAIRTLDRSNEAWEHLYRSRLALLLAVLLGALALSAAYRL